MDGEITLNKTEQETANILARLTRGELTNSEAAEKLGVSVRQVQRKKACYLKDGIFSVIHGLKKNPSKEGYGEGFKEQIVGLYIAEYFGWNFHHFNDKLETDYEVILSDSYIYNTLTYYGITSPKRKRHKPKGHPPRNRRENAGELIQVDASHHIWIDLAGKKHHLHAGIDDATGILTAAILQEQETIYGYQLMLAETIRGYGIPKCLYSDYRTVFQSNKKLTIEEELAGKETEDTKFAKMLKHLGIGIISTTVPQAKGRIERAWETLQDRLTKELKKAGITDMNEANEYIRNVFIPDFNKRFATKIDETHNDFVPVQPDFDYNKELAILAHQRICQQTYIQSDGDTYAIFKDNRPVQLNTHSSVEVYIYLDGSRHIKYKNEWYDLKKIERLKVPKPTKPPRTRAEINASKAHKPAADHPWRQNMMMQKDKKVTFSRE